MAMSTTTLPGRANIPGAVARTSTIALTAATLPYLTQVAANHITGAAATNPAVNRPEFSGGWVLPSAGLQTVSL